MVKPWFPVEFPLNQSIDWWAWGAGRGGFKHFFRAQHRAGSVEITVELEVMTSFMMKSAGSLILGRLHLVNLQVWKGSDIVRSWIIVTAW